jgi:hypothetical protein
MLTAAIRHRPKEMTMTFLTRIFATLAIGAVTVLAAAGVYAEAHRLPDQP